MPHENMKPLLAAAGGHCYVKMAAQVCAVCKARKKKCDKVLPSCRNCIRKHMNCVYDYESPPRDHRKLEVGSGILTPATTPTTPRRFFPTSSEAALHVEVHRLIRATGRFVDDISARYFRGLHRHLPIVSRARFHSGLLTVRETPSAAFSVLLLTICLVSSPPDTNPGGRTAAAAASSASSSPTEDSVHSAAAPLEPLDCRSLYLTARSYLAQVQALFPPSIHLVQAGILLALYEYAYGDPDKAFASVAACARLAYAAGIVPKSVSAASKDLDADVQLQEAEEANTWWGLVICERIFYCDVAAFEQPLITSLTTPPPHNKLEVPIEPDILEQSDGLNLWSVPRVLVEDLTAPDVGGFGRSAQAAWLLDQVFKSFTVPDWDTRLQQLSVLDRDLQAFLAMLIHPCYEGKGAVCETIALAIRALFTLHCHIVAQLPPAAQSVGVGVDTEEWRNRSLAALDTTARMVLEIVVSNDNMEHLEFDAIAPSYTYIVRASIRHLSGRVAGGRNQDVDMDPVVDVQGNGDYWPQTARERLCLALDQFNRRWGLNPSRTA